MKPLGTLALHAPLPWALLLNYLAPRRVPGIEQVDADSYTRRIGQGAVRARLHADADRLLIDADVPLAVSEVAARLTRLFALDEDHAPARRHLRRSAALRPRIARTPGLRPLGCWDPFELCVRTVLGQQVTVAAAATLMGRFVDRCGEITPARVLGADLSNMGMPGRRVETVRSLAAAIVDGRLRFDAGWPEIDAALRALPGFGPWTRQYLAIRLGREADAFPESDVGLIRAAGAASPRELLQMAEAWRPYRSLAAIYLWAG
ncbi:MAG TPA: AlkA N-terminal domain-containing protein [Fontimonas sp.]